MPSRRSSTVMIAAAIVLVLSCVSTQTVMANEPPGAEISDFQLSSVAVGVPCELCVLACWDDDGTIVKYIWNADSTGVDPARPDSTIAVLPEKGQSMEGEQGPVAHWTYQKPGRYIVTLVVVDDKGARSQIERCEVLVAHAPVLRATVTAYERQQSHWVDRPVRRAEGRLLFMADEKVEVSLRDTDDADGDLQDFAVAWGPAPGRKPAYTATLKSARAQAGDDIVTEFPACDMGVGESDIAIGAGDAGGRETEQRIEVLVLLPPAIELEVLSAAEAGLPQPSDMSDEDYRRTFRLRIRVLADEDGSPALPNGPLRTYAFDPLGGSDWTKLVIDAGNPHAQMSYTYPTDEPWLAAARVTDARGAWATAYGEVNAIGLVAKFTVTPPMGPSPLTVQLDPSESTPLPKRLDDATHTLNDPNRIVKYLWNLDVEGETSRTHESALPETLTCTYEEEGAYVIGLRVVDALGRESLEVYETVVAAPGCTDDQVWALFPSTAEVGMVGVPFHRTRTAPGTYSATWAEKPLGRVYNIVIAARHTPEHAVALLEFVARSHRGGKKRIDVGDAGYVFHQKGRPHQVSFIVGNVDVAVRYHVSSKPEDGPLAIDFRMPNLDVLRQMAERIRELPCLVPPVKY